jgi:hypothetical protein
MNIKLYCLKTINDDAPYSVSKDRIYDVFYDTSGAYCFLDDDNLSILYAGSSTIYDELIYWIKTQKNPIFMLYEDWLANHREEQIKSIL